MASEILSHPHAPPAAPPALAATPPLVKQLERLLLPLASLRLTVALFAMSIFLIFAGTLAQTSMDVWDVVRLYFRTWVAWIDVQVFFPPSFFPSRPIVPGAFP